LQFSSSLLKKLGPKQAAYASVGSNCHSSCKNTESKSVLLDDFICGHGFDKVMNATCQESEEFEDDCGRHLFKNPNLALKVGHSLGKLAKLKLGSAIRSRDVEAKADAEAFIALFDAEFTDAVASRAHASVKIMPRRLQEFPDSADLTLLKNYIIETTEKLSRSLNETPSQHYWRELAEVMPTRLLVFNGRRGSEVADLKLTEYDKRTNKVHSNVWDNMSEIEREMMNRYTLYHYLLFITVVCLI